MMQGDRDIALTKACDIKKKKKKGEEPDTTSTNISII